jgi:inosine-uridine nucleoside N-ribohydrolase
MAVSRLTHKASIAVLFIALSTLFLHKPSLATESKPLKVVLDTDLGFASDDAMALLILLQSERADLLGVTVVTGNDWASQEVANALRLLEIAGRPDVPVYPGAARPLVNSQEEMRIRENLYGETSDGGYKGAWRDGGPGPDDVVPPDGSLAERQPESAHAADFLIEAIRAHPNDVVVAAIGPLTNVALAVAKDPEIATLTKELVIMGGGIDTLPEFNFWMDPEAARMVLRAPWPKVTLTPLNICRQAPFTPEVAKAASEGDSPIAHYFADTFLQRISSHPVSPLMYDQIAVLSLLEPDLIIRSEPMWLDAEIDHGALYGATLFWKGNRTPPPGVRKVNVHVDLDYPRFIERFLALMKK